MPWAVRIQVRAETPFSGHISRGIKYQEERNWHHFGAEQEMIKGGDEFPRKERFREAR